MAMLNLPETISSGLGRLLVIAQLLGGVHQREAVAADRLATTGREVFIFRFNMWNQK